MKNFHSPAPSTGLSFSPVSSWKIVQSAFWILGLALLGTMFLLPPLGVTLFWNILIPIAPALLVVGTGIWRNICPLATTSLLPDRLGFSRKKKLSGSVRTLFNLIGVVILFAVIPLRHVLFNTSGEATGMIILLMGVAAVAAGSLYERKSGWCSGLCPIHGVEKLYGSGVGVTLPNAQCDTCVKCTIPCADSTPNANPLTLKKSRLSEAIEYLLIGAFPGYVWGWFQVPDFQAGQGWKYLNIVYEYPIFGAIGTFILYLFFSEFLDNSKRKQLMNIFAAAAVSCYYWYRLPLLFGFTSMETNSTLIDLSHTLPWWSMILLNAFTTSFFVWWMVIRRKPRQSWSVRPVYA